MAKSKEKSQIGYDHYKDKNFISCTAEIGKGKEQEPLLNGSVVTIHPKLSIIAEVIRANREEGQPIPEGFTTIKAQTTTRSRGNGREH